MDVEKSAITTLQVFKLFDKLVKNPNFIISLKDWIGETYFTENLIHTNSKSSVYIYTHHKAKKSFERRVILLSNDEKIIEKILAFYKKSGHTIKYKEDIPFTIMNSDELKNLLEKWDGSYFRKICELIG